MTAIATATPSGRTKRYRPKFVDERQLDLFGDDPFAALQVIEAAEVAQAQVDFALEAAPSVLAGVGAEVAAKAKESLDFAQFMRNAGAPADEVRESLAAAGDPDPEAALDRLQQIEEVLGAADPQAPAAEDLADLADALDSGADLDEDSDSGQDGEELTGQGDLDEQEPKTKGRRAADDGVTSSALAALLRRIRDPRYAPLDEAGETALAVRIKAGDKKARDELIERNMRFLVMSAKKFRYTGRPLDVLVSFGMAGLIVAAEKFDPTRGSFTTCAALWIRQSIQRELQKDSLMKTPAYLSTKENKLKKAVEEAPNEQERDRLADELAKVSAELKARRAMHVSMDGGADDDSDSGGLHNMFASEEAGPEEQMEQRQLVTQMVKSANALPDQRCSTIFLMRLGLHPDFVGEPRTLGEIAQDFNISRERVRQIYVEGAHDVANAMIVWARGPENLPADFKKKLVNPSCT